MSTSGLEEEQTLVVSEFQDSVSEWSDMSTSGLEEGYTILIPRQPVFVLPLVHWKTCRSIRIHYPDSETTSVCSSSSPLVDMSLHSDTLS
jgi:hypothetical protein